MSQQDQLDLRAELYRISGVDLTRIDGISLQTAQKILFEIGTDVKAWADEKKFTCWLGLSPNHRISGGKVLSHLQPSLPPKTNHLLSPKTLKNPKFQTPHYQRDPTGVHGEDDLLYKAFSGVLERSSSSSSFVH
jgi:hypothetical protein